MVKAATLERNKAHLLKEIQTKYKKLDYSILVNEKYELKDYLKTMTLSKARMKFRIRTKMVENIAFNYSSDPKFTNRLWLCTHCDRMDSQSHVIICEGYKHLREGKDLNSDTDLVDYFKGVISLREKLEDIV